MDELEFRNSHGDGKIVALAAAGTIGELILTELVGLPIVLGGAILLGIGFLIGQRTRRT